ncbi:hypothetical protein MLD38_029502 [Melastoma candidum]|uniref:Uncharacterized protein n=1 Tax=Melastoma candidum TaxID=119954 RepID=A0ACB9N861_9MYRT|nr:hypothetical protein MLD38_029502 [Melastoma candidum]
MGLEDVVASLRRFWNEWDLRLMVLVSLALQVILMFLGNRRKFSPKVSMRVVVWCAYISADSIAGVALGILSSKLGQINKKSSSLDDHSKLIAFWAPPLLLLLGGPDTITAYALEDNELWLRHLLGLVVQTVVTLYIYFMAWSPSYLSLLSSLMIVAGLIKFGERVWVLWNASSDKLRDSMLDPPDPSPVYHRFMEEYTLKQAEGYHVTADEVVEIQVHEDLSALEGKSGPRGAEEELQQAYRLFRVFRRLFVELILSEDDKNASLAIFRNRQWLSAFNVVEIELGFVYDILHTKAMVLYNHGGTYRRLVTLVITCFVLASFCSLKRPRYHTIDLALTLILLTVVILMDVYSILILLSSDWTGVWIEKKEGNSALRKIVARLQWLKQPRWSNSMGQFSLLSFCVQEKPLCCRGLLKAFNVIEKVEKYHNTTHKLVPNTLKESIFGDLMEKFHKGERIKYDHKELSNRVLDGYGSRDLTWSTQLEFDECILVWHIATELCHYTDKDMLSEEEIPNFMHSRLLARYMFYLLVMYPFMLPSGISQIRLRDTIAEATKFFAEKNLLPPQKRSDGNGTGAPKQATELLLKVNTQVPPSKVKGGRSKSVLFDGCRLAAGLNKKSYTDVRLKWEMISKVWVELLLCASNQCRGERHARQVRRGGELITHVWMMMAHYGFTDHFQMTQGHAIAKLILR